MKLSIVTTIYKSAPYLQEFYERITLSSQKVTDDYEIIFVNDGSPDNSLEIVVGFYENDEKVKVIDLSRNFGHHKAMMTGLSHAQGERIFLVDCDLEEEPELLNQFWVKFENLKNVDVVYGVQIERKGFLFENITGAIFYKLFNFLSEYKIPANIITVRLMSKRYVENLTNHKESEILIGGLWSITGFNQVAFPVNKHHKGSSTYNLKKKFTILVNSITSFSSKPLICIFYSGFLVLFLSITYSLYLATRKLFFNLPVPGYTSIIISIWFLGGLIIFFLGVVGIYLSKMFIEIKNRPYTIIRLIYERKKTENSIKE